jgi:hypothetical protein
MTGEKQWNELYLPSRIAKDAVGAEIEPLRNSATAAVAYLGMTAYGVDKETKNKVTEGISIASDIVGAFATPELISNRSKESGRGGANWKSSSNGQSNNIYIDTPIYNTEVITVSKGGVKTAEVSGNVTLTGNVGAAAPIVNRQAGTAVGIELAGGAAAKTVDSTPTNFGSAAKVEEAVAEQRNLGKAGEGITSSAGTTIAAQGASGSMPSIMFGNTANAAETAAAAERMDVSAQFAVSKTPQGVRLQYGDPNGWSAAGGDSHGIIGFVDKDGILGVDVFASAERRAQYGSGRDMYNSMMTRLRQENVDITGIRGAWLKGTDSVNYAQYQSGLAAGLEPAQSALNTWTGKLAQSYGYGQVESITGSNSNVYVIFRKPGSGK